jgi:hypothetical protein
MFWGIVGVRPDYGIEASSGIDMSCIAFLDHYRRQELILEGLLQLIVCSKAFMMRRLYICICCIE